MPELCCLFRWDISIPPSHCWSIPLMTSIAVEISTEASPSAVWDAIRDIGALHTRLVPGFVVATELVPGGRRVTFANGMIVVEPIVSLNEELHRLVWTTQGGSSGLVHY